LPLAWSCPNCAEVARADDPKEPPPPPADAVSPPRIESAELLRGGRLIVIAHAGEEYRLLVTRTNRLILQK
jgi:hemin uptake protein HemP